MLGQEGSDPVFGSVAQAWTTGLSPVTGVDTTFTGDRFTLEIKRRDGNNANLDTNRDPVSIVNEYSPSENLVTDRPAVDGYIAKTSSSELTVAGAMVEWSNTDYTDYVAGGYWLHLDLVSSGVEIGAFVDGPDYEGAVTLPPSGTAAYNGRAAGVFINEYGTDAEVPPGTVSAGEYGGSLRLTANFGTNTIAGHIDDIELFDIHVLTPGGISYQADDERSAYVLQFGSTDIGADGRFTGRDITLTNPEEAISSSGGLWAGRFSTEDDSSGNPRAVVGTHQGYRETSGGSEAIFVGAHYGATERFE